MKHCREKAFYQTVLPKVSILPVKLNDTYIIYVQETNRVMSMVLFKSRINK